MRTQNLEVVSTKVVGLAGLSTMAVSIKLMLNRASNLYLWIGGPSKMTFGTSNHLVFFLDEGYMIIKDVLGSTRPGLHDVLKKN